MLKSGLDHCLGIERQGLFFLFGEISVSDLLDLFLESARLVKVRLVSIAEGIIDVDAKIGEFFQ